MSGPRFGLTGLAVMGANLARNVAHHDIPIAVHNRTASKTEQFMAEHGGEGPITGTGIGRGVRRRAGAPAHDHDHGQGRRAGRRRDRRARPAPRRGRHDRRRRQLALPRHPAPRQGAGRAGPALPRRRRVRRRGGRARRGRASCPAATARPTPTSSTSSPRSPPRSTARRAAPTSAPDGAGHYVKMVHNGIEYADIQLIAEAYDLLRHGVGLEVPEIAQVFDGWNEGDLDSFLIEITAIVLGKTDERHRPAARRRDPRRGRAEGHRPLDRAGRARARRPAHRHHRGGLRPHACRRVGDERATASSAARRPAARRRRTPPTARFVDDVQRALYASKVVAYAQGFAQMTAAAEAEGWDLDLGEMATIWRGGCIIRARFLDRIREAYEADPQTPNLLLRRLLPRRGRRRPGLVAARGRPSATERGIPVPAFSSALAYYDGYRRERGPANLIQGLRDLLRRPHLPARRPRGQLPHPLGPGRQRGPHRHIRLPIRGARAETCALTVAW